ncbi:sulfatase-like hydrolase/transferase [Candidatus Gracilibacteria bacterium]|nr:sulfatase-like hydrolase/transferase [Candidatus Gracilibacteria bacterium]
MNINKKIKRIYKKIINYIKYFFLLFKFRLHPAAIAFLFAIFLIIKQFVFFHAYQATIRGFYNYFLFFINDLLLLSFVFLLGYITLSSKKLIIKIISNLVNIFIMITFLIDIFTTKFFQSRLSLFELSGFLDIVNSGVTGSYMGFTLVSILLFILINHVLLRYFKFPKNRKLILSVIILFISISFTISKFSSYNNIRLQKNIIAFNITNIASNNTDNLQTVSKDREKYEDYFHIVKGKNKNLNLILLFAESFSAADSLRAGGIKDNFPYFDKIQSQGITFTNFISNGCTSDNAHIAVFQGIEPLYCPDNKDLKAYFKYKSYTDPLPVFFNNLGYKTIFLSSAGLGFLDQRGYLLGLNFQEVIGEELFKDKKKYTFDSAPDYYLYEEAIKTVSNQTGNFFLGLQTISSHTPYYTPYGDSSQDMFQYVDRNLYAFYQKLKRIGFFDNGILIIVSDHRKMQPLTKDEIDVFGKIAYAKILATVVGSGIKPNTFNNNIVQHVDFFSSIKNYRGSGNITISSIYNDPILNTVNRDRGITYCAYFDNKYGAITQSGDFYKFRNNSQSLSGSEFQKYINAFQIFQSDLFSGNLDILKDTVILGHRGASAQAPENTFQAFQLAKDYGADGVEFDISYTQDNVNIIEHGPNLVNTNCGADKQIKDYTLDYIKKNCRFKNGEKPMTLEEILSIIKDMFDYYYLEIKVYDTSKAAQQTLDAIQTVEKLGLQDKVIFISYDPTANHIIGSYNGIIAGWDDYNTGSINIIKNFPHPYYLLEKGYINQEVVDRIDLIGKKLVTYTVNDPLEFEKLYKLGVRVFMTDNIPLIKNKLLEIIKE